MENITSQLKNDAGETYFLKVASDQPAAFLRGLWESVDRFASEHDDEYFLGELTDRMRDFRTTVSRGYGVSWEVCIRTHAWTPAGDKKELHSDVLDYLQATGVTV